MDDATTGRHALTEPEAAKYLGVSTGYLSASRLKAPRTRGPAYVRIGRRAIRYLVKDLDAFLESRTVRHPEQTDRGDVLAAEAR